MLQNFSSVCRSSVPGEEISSFSPNNYRLSASSIHVPHEEPQKLSQWHKWYIKLCSSCVPRGPRRPGQLPAATRAPPPLSGSGPPRNAPRGRAWRQPDGGAVRPARGRFGPEEGGGSAGGGRGGSEARALLSRALGPLASPAVCARAAGSQSTYGRARAAARGVRVRVGGPGRREVRAGGRASGVPGRHAHTLSEERSPRLLFLGQTESGSVSPPSTRSPRVSPRGGCSSSALPAPALLRSGRRRRRDPGSRFVCSPTRGGDATT